MTDVAGKTIYITGGARGMGLIAGKTLAALGDHIVSSISTQPTPPFTTSSPRVAHPANASPATN
jgi:NAD(P)-dependent dehydrogenase (short-subunit alcohol dehydrogenase family)